MSGVAPVGVPATDDVDALIGEAPDCVVYTPHFIDYALVDRMLRAGINVVTTGDFLTGTHHPKERAALEAAAVEGGATFLGTGFEPGFINVAAGFLTGACRRVHSVKLVETPIFTPLSSGRQAPAGLTAGRAAWQSEHCSI